MTKQTVVGPSALELAGIVEALNALKVEVTRLGERLNALEAAAARTSQATAAEVPSEELIAVIGAAVAAYLGKKAHVRQIRMISSPAWGMQGRVTIQASHHVGGLT
jgi:methylmalonyl-CoA carboxyltransferase large subunit